MSSAWRGKLKVWEYGQLQGGKRCCRRGPLTVFVGLHCLQKAKALHHPKCRSHFYSCHYMSNTHVDNLPTRTTSYSFVQRRTLFPCVAVMKSLSLSYLWLTQPCRMMGFAMAALWVPQSLQLGYRLQAASKLPGKIYKGKNRPTSKCYNLSKLKISLGGRVSQEAL